MKSAFYFICEVLCLTGDAVQYTVCCVEQLIDGVEQTKSTDPVTPFDIILHKPFIGCAQHTEPSYKHTRTLKNFKLNFYIPESMLLYAVSGFENSTTLDPMFLINKSQYPLKALSEGFLIIQATMLN